jgi:hypothetical protein
VKAEGFAPCPLAYFACCQPPGQISLSIWYDGEPHQISMPSLLAGKLGPFELLPTHCTNISPFPAANTGSLDAQLRIHVRFVLCAGRTARRQATSRRKEFLTKLSSQRPYRHATDMRICCGGVCVGASQTDFGSPRVAGRRNPVSSPGVDGGRGIASPKFADSVQRQKQCRVQAGRRAACEVQSANQLLVGGPRPAIRYSAIPEYQAWFCSCSLLHCTSIFGMSGRAGP